MAGIGPERAPHGGATAQTTRPTPPLGGVLRGVSENADCITFP